MSDDLSKSVRDRLKHTAEVTAICGPHIYADVLEQGTDGKVLPAVVVFIDNSSPEEDLNTSARLSSAQVNVWAIATDRDTANLLAKQIRDVALPATLQGRIEGMDWNECSLVRGPVEAVDDPKDGSDRWRRFTQQTFNIWATPV